LFGLLESFWTFQKLKKKSEVKKSLKLLKVSFTRFGEQNRGATTVLDADGKQPHATHPRRCSWHFIEQIAFAAQPKSNLAQDIPVTVCDAGGFSALQPAIEF